MTTRSTTCGDALPQRELEARLLYSVIVAGKSAKFAEVAMERFYHFIEQGESPFQYVRRMDVSLGQLALRLRTARTGNYSKIEKAFRGIVGAGFDLTICTPADLEKIYGIGPKTSRFFILWTRPGARHAALDTHVLKWLLYLGHDAPKSTPSAKKYAELERVFLAEADRLGLEPRALDAAIWDWCSQHAERVNAGEWPELIRRRTAQTGMVLTAPGGPAG